MNKAIGLACLHLGVAIILGALGAHKLEELLTPDHLSAFKTGVEYHIYHGLALLLINSSPVFNQLKNLKTINLLFNLGIVFFCVSIYVLSTAEISGFTGQKILGPITPLGGLFFIGTWFWLAIRFFMAQKSGSNQK